MSESVTRTLRKTITDKDIRKNVTKILLNTEDEDNPCYEIYFKEDTVKNAYELNYMEYTTCPISLDINEWLKEIVAKEN